MARKVLVLIVVLLIGGVIVWNDRDKPALKSAGGQPQFAVQDINGQPLSSDQLRGKVVLVDFWATWCAPCEAEIPQLERMQKERAGDGLQVIGFSMDDSAAPVKTYVRQHDILYPVAIADEKTIAAFGGVLGLPANILIGRDGHLIAKHVGVSDMHALEDEVVKALAAR